MHDSFLVWLNNDPDSYGNAWELANAETTEIKAIGSARYYLDTQAYSQVLVMRQYFVNGKPAYKEEYYSQIPLRKTTTINQRKISL